MKIKNLLNVSAAACLLMASSADAADYSHVKYGTIGYLNPYIALASAYNARGGESVVVLAEPVDYASTLVFCGVFDFNSPPGSDALFYYYDYQGPVRYTAPYDSFHMHLCIHADGASGRVLTAALQGAAVASVQAKSLDMLPQADVPPDLYERLQQAAEQQRQATQAPAVP